MTYIPIRFTKEAKVSWLNKIQQEGFKQECPNDEGVWERAMSTIERAIEIAAHAHAGQIDKGGQPYIFHPLRVMLRFSDVHEQMVAVLHDVIEDTSVTLDVLKSEGFPPEVLDAVSVLTKKKGETRIEAAKRALTNPIARKVKLADVEDNMNLSRIPNPVVKDYLRLKEYEKVKAVLLERLAEVRTDE